MRNPGLGQDIYPHFIYTVEVMGLPKGLKRGITLVEIIVALGLISLSLMLVLSLIPAGLHSAQRAEDIQAAAAWSRELLETAPVPDKFPISAKLANSAHSKRISSTDFTATRHLATIPGKAYRYKVSVEIRWARATQPFQVSVTKFHPGGPLP